MGSILDCHEVWSFPLNVNILICMHSPCLLHKCQKMVMSQWLSGLIINLLEFSLWPNCSIIFFFPLHACGIFVCATDEAVRVCGCACVLYTLGCT